jgi:flagellum-specific peptidoglycan hydrolase FlgJ
MQVKAIILLGLFFTQCQGNVEQVAPSNQTHEEIFIEVTTKTQGKYIDEVVLPNCLFLPNDVPKSVIIAQAIIESGNGTSSLSRTHHNHFGHRTNNGYVRYKSDKECFLSHYKLLRKRYNALGGYNEWCNALTSKKYAETPNYGKRIKNTIAKYKLYKIDKI